MNNKTVTMAHGAGGKQTSELIDEVFKAHFFKSGSDSGWRCCSSGSKRKDCHVNRWFYCIAAFFPGGNIGKLSICGTVNDLACMGAKPLYLPVPLLLKKVFRWRNWKRSRVRWRKQPKRRCPHCIRWYEGCRKGSGGRCLYYDNRCWRNSWWRQHIRRLCKTGRCYYCNRWYRPTWMYDTAGKRRFRYWMRM